MPLAFKPLLAMAEGGGRPEGERHTKRDKEKENRDTTEERKSIKRESHTEEQ